MKYNWEKLGLILDPKGRAEWMKTHCQLPIADHIKGDIYRIYFATRNEIQVSQIGYVEIDIKNPKEIIKISEKPILRNGDLGYFDEHGVFPSSIVNFIFKPIGLSGPQTKQLLALKSGCVILI